MENENNQTGNGEEQGAGADPDGTLEARREQIEQRRNRQYGTEVKTNQALRKFVIMIAGILAFISLPLIIFGPEAVFKAAGMGGADGDAGTPTSIASDEVSPEPVDSNFGLKIPRNKEAENKKERDKKNRLEQERKQKERIAKLEAQLKELASSKKGLSQEEVMDFLKKREAAMRKEQEEQLKLERERLQSEMALEQQQNLTAQQQREAEAIEAERQAEIESNKVKSSGLIFDDSKDKVVEALKKAREARKNQQANTSLPYESDSSLSADENFLQRAANAEFETSIAKKLANPSRMVVQGTIISAVLETAINTQLPGNIRAQITENVYSYDGSRILMPSGTRLVGTFSTDVKTAQKRVLIAWNRAITPKGKSVALGGTGADRLGRSGTAGHVNNRYAARFGGAFLISAISAIPQLFTIRTAGSGVASRGGGFDNSGGDAGGGGGFGALSGVAGSGGGQAASALQQRFSLKPVISIPQGEDIRVFVNRDLFF